MTRIEEKAPSILIETLAAKLAENGLDTVTFLKEWRAVMRQHIAATPLSKYLNGKLTDNGRVMLHPNAKARKVILEQTNKVIAAYGFPATTEDELFFPSPGMMEEIKGALKFLDLCDCPKGWHYEKYAKPVSAQASCSALARKGLLKMVAAKTYQTTEKGRLFLKNSLADKRGNIHADTVHVAGIDGKPLCMKKATGRLATESLPATCRRCLHNTGASIITRKTRKGKATETITNAKGNISITQAVL